MSYRLRNGGLLAVVLAVPVATNMVLPERTTSTTVTASAPDEVSQNSGQSPPSSASASTLGASPISGVGAKLELPPVQPQLPAGALLDDQPGVRRRTGGPYAAIEGVKAQVGTSLGCATTPGIQANTIDGRCESIVTTSVMTYSDAMKAHPDWGTPGGIGPDREVYFVTMRGRFKFFPRSMRADAKDGIWTEYFNFEIDATTGDLLGRGTQGSPLA